VGDAKSRDVPARMAVQQKVFSVEIAVRIANPVGWDITYTMAAA